MLQTSSATAGREASSMFDLECEFRKAVCLANAVCVFGLHGIHDNGLEKEDAESLLEIGYALLGASRTLENRYHEIYTDRAEPIKEDTL